MTQKRFIKTLNVTKDGELAQKSIYAINQSIIDEETKYDGLLCCMYEFRRSCRRYY